MISICDLVSWPTKKLVFELKKRDGQLVFHIFPLFQIAIFNYLAAK